VVALDEDPLLPEEAGADAAGEPDPEVAEEVEPVVEVVDEVDDELSEVLAAAGSLADPPSVEDALPRLSFR
jgi:hypothetical protein